MSWKGGINNGNQAKMIHVAVGETHTALERRTGRGFDCLDDDGDDGGGGIPYLPHALPLTPSTTLRMRSHEAVDAKREEHDMAQSLEYMDGRVGVYYAARRQIAFPRAGLRQRQGGRCGTSNSSICVSGRHVPQGRRGLRTWRDNVSTSCERHGR